MLFKLNENKESYTRVRRTNLAEIGWKEKDLENLLSKNIQDLIWSNDLMTISTEIQGQEAPDILALDKTGDLYIFELKRWPSQQGTLLQVLKYGQLYGNSTYGELNRKYKEFSNSNKKEDLLDAYKVYFALADSEVSESNINAKQHFVVVANGVDQDTVEAISYWKKSGLNIDAIIYWIFEINGEHFIEFNMYSPIEGFLEYESCSYIVNTNMTSNSIYTEEMLSEQKVAAYYPTWREKITRLQKGDTVFLFKNGEGIVAYGNADGNVQKKDCDGHKDYEFFMKLNDFKKLKSPISANEMTTVAKHGFPWPQTLYSISEETKNRLLEAIQDNHS
jgi:hypothetical protein